MDIIAVFVIIFFVFLLFKFLGTLFHAGAFVITLPFKILGAVISIAFFALFIFPLAVVFAILPIALIIFGLWLIVKNS